MNEKSLALVPIGKLSIGKLSIVLCILHISISSFRFTSDYSNANGPMPHMFFLVEPGASLEFHGFQEDPGSGALPCHQIPIPLATCNLFIVRSTCNLFIVRS